MAVIASGRRKAGSSLRFKRAPVDYQPDARPEPHLKAIEMPARSGLRGQAHQRFCLRIVAQTRRFSLFQAVEQGEQRLCRAQFMERQRDPTAAGQNDVKPRRTFAIANFTIAT